MGMFAGGKLAESGLDIPLKAIAIFAILAPVYVAAPFLGRSIGSSPQFDFLLAGSFVVHIWTRPRRADIAATVVLAVLIRQPFLVLAGGFQPYFASSLIQWGAFLGLGSMVVSGARALSGPRSSKNTFGAVALFPYLSVLLAFSIPMGEALNPKTYDLFLYAFDCTLGFQPSFLLGRLLAISPLVWGVGAMLYQALPVEIAMMYASSRANPGRYPVNVLMLFITPNLFGFLLFCVLPACGPSYAFAGSFPSSTIPVSALSIAPMVLAKVARNCIPSLHLTAALLIWWNTRRAGRWVRVAAGTYLAVVFVTTLGYGEHYLIDLVVAVPFSLAMQAIWTNTVPFRCPERRMAVMAGAVMATGWIFALRFGIHLLLAAPLIAWSAVVVTVYVSCWLEHKLAAVSFSPLTVPSSVDRGVSYLVEQEDRRVPVAGL
jgi:hypothetical protein